MSFEALIRTGRKRPIFTPGEGTVGVDLGRAEIERMIPHRPPFLLVDRIHAVDLPARAALGTRTIDPADPVMTGHFPGDPIYPGVLLLETMGQLGLCLSQLVLWGRTAPGPDDRARPVRLLKLHHAAFLAEARPGDRLTVVGQLLEPPGGYTETLAGQILRDDALLAFAIMEAYQPEA
jgi:3-hydroxymyristoyl/3-hydroxydecanoyl-(acyl carrier protein) dehydratase